MTTEAMTKAFFKKIGESEKTNRTIIKNGMLTVSSELFSVPLRGKNFRCAGVLRTCESSNVYYFV